MSYLLTVGHVFFLPCFFFLGDGFIYVLLILRGAIDSRTYGSHQNLYIYLFLRAIFGPVYYGPPKYLYQVPCMSVRVLYQYLITARQEGSTDDLQMIYR